MEEKGASSAEYAQNLPFIRRQVWSVDVQFEVNLSGRAEYDRNTLLKARTESRRETQLDLVKTPPSA